MKKTLLAICFATLFLVGCSQKFEQRNIEMKAIEGKTVSEAYQKDTTTAVIRFDDGTVIEFKKNGDHLYVNGKSE